MKETLSCYMNRELSWLKFNERVLEEAEDEKVPLCERLSFISIFQSNLDEFFRVRVGSLIDQMFLDSSVKENKTEMTSEEQINAVLYESKKLAKRKDFVYEVLKEELDKQGVQVADFSMFSEEEMSYMEQYYDTEIAPLISPILLGKTAPFPFLKNRDIYSAVLLKGKNGKAKVGIIPCTNNVIPRLIKSPFREGTYILSEELILHFAAKVFKRYTVTSKTLFRVTRNADIDADSLYDEDLDYRDMMVQLIKKRKKLSPLRLELSREVDNEIINTLCKNLELDKKYIFQSSAPLDMKFVFQIQDDLRKHQDLFFSRRVPQNSAAFDLKRSIMEQIQEKDKMLAMPFESMRPFLMLLREAVADPDVLSIKMTLYRVASNSKIVEALVEAAESGKDVLVLVELRARFDEENNIEWSRRLEDAGCHVIYGLEGYKVHSKLCLITRKTAEGISYITQIGTGNYNEKTATLYTDLMVMTADVNIGVEASAIFQSLALGEVIEQSEVLMVAPKCLQNKVIALIEREIETAKNGEPAYIGLKLNSLTDKKIIDKLIEASCAGVQIDMVVRGICCLVAGVKGYTENIRVFSIVGRYLEHSRIYIFGCGECEKVYIASADFMTRNTLRRVEVAVPVQDNDLKERIQHMFVTMLEDNCKVRRMNSKGIYERMQTAGNMLNAQEYFYQAAYEAAKPQN